MKYTADQRTQVSEHAEGKTIQTMEWDEVGLYWVITFTNGEEICVRLIDSADIAQTRQDLTDAI